MICTITHTVPLNYENETHKSNSYAEYNVDSNEKNPKFKVGDHVKISEYKNIFAKRFVRNWSEEVFVIGKIKNAIPWTYLINDLNSE